MNRRDFIGYRQKLLKLRMFRIYFTNGRLFFASWSPTGAEGENTRNLTGFRKLLRLRVLGFGGVFEGHGGWLYATCPRHFTVVKMPSNTVTKALHDRKGCLLYRYNDAS